MTIQGLVQAAELQENPPGSDRIELVLKVQGVGPTAPRKFIVPYELLVADEGLDPDLVQGRPFRAEIEEESKGVWNAVWIQAGASRVLRPE